MGMAVHSSALTVLSPNCRHMTRKQQTLCGQDLSSKASGLTNFLNLVIWQGFWHEPRMSNSPCNQWFSHATRFLRSLMVLLHLGI